ncbi:MAG: hypothetical protein BMS9Abin36_0693 [Gammaproteobacteria bacterium]|nr:MAG: hypothetical protein BMS9Abin36_0693 [Gammaproteobacteria bacterium]
MARITVEDCLDNVDNRFQLVLVAAKRARQIMLGAEPHVEFDNDKATVLALREIADGHVTSAILDEEVPEVVLDEDEAADEIEAKATEDTGEAVASPEKAEGEAGEEAAS